MKPFLDNDFLLNSETARRLYHEYAKNLPILDYHNHLPPAEIADNRVFENISQVWLNGDHYKWRAMRAAGVDERFITGAATDNEKFEKWAQTVPYTMRNPLYHWTHLELRRYFGESRLLDAKTSKSIFEGTREKLAAPDYSTQHLLRKMNVEVVCTTDDPTDSLEHHIRFGKQEPTKQSPAIEPAASKNLRLLPSFRPDKFILIESPQFFSHIEKLENLAGASIKNFSDLIEELNKRALFFDSQGCKLSDHGLEQLYAEEFTIEEADKALHKALAKETLTQKEILAYKSAILQQLGETYHALGWVQQFHLGALRNNNERKLIQLGADTGWDSVGDFKQARPLSKFLNRLEYKNKLARTIIYNLNPADNEIFATMIGNFNDGSTAGKIQWGSAWWFLDQKDGMTRQINALSNMAMLSRFVGMLTDSRSFLSFPRHEYFRRLLCDLFGQDVEKGELPNDINWIGQLVRDICYYNAKRYFDF